jgi:hypothetical protein
VARRSLAGRWRAGYLVRENEKADYLDLLAASCLTLTRTVMATSLPERRSLGPSMRRLAAALTDLAEHPGEPVSHRHAADHALEVVHALADSSAPSEASLAAAIMAARMVAADIMSFAGVDPE